MSKFLFLPKMQPTFHLYQLSKHNPNNFIHSLNLSNQYVVTTQLDIIEPISVFEEEDLSSFLGESRWVFHVGNVKGYEQYSGKNRVTGTDSIFIIDNQSIKINSIESYLIWAPVVEFYLENEVYRARLKEIENIFDKSNPFPDQGVSIPKSPDKIQNLIGFII